MALWPWTRTHLCCPRRAGAQRKRGTRCLRTKGLDGEQTVGDGKSVRRTTVVREICQRDSSGQEELPRYVCPTTFRTIRLYHKVPNATTVDGVTRHPGDRGASTHPPQQHGRKLRPLHLPHIVTRTTTSCTDRSIHQSTRWAERSKSAKSARSIRRSAISQSGNRRCGRSVGPWSEALLNAHERPRIREEGRVAWGV